MSQNIQALLAMANAAADEAAIDMSEVSKGGGGGRLLPAGYAFGRLVRYVEFGMQPQEYQGQAKQPALEFRLGFALWGDSNPADPRPPAERPETLWHNSDGTPSFLSTWDMSLSNNEKAKSKIIFDKMNWKGTAKHYAQFLSEGFLIRVDHQDIKGQPGKKRAVLNLKETLPPIDLISRQPYPIPTAPDDAYQLFLWTRPTLEGWNALKIEGTRDDGKSKNFLQDKILSAVDFHGSPLEQLLRGSGAALPTPEELAAAQPSSAPAVPAATPQVPQVPAAHPDVAAAPFDGAVPSVPVVPSVPQVPSVPAAVPAVPQVPQVPQVPAAG